MKISKVRIRNYKSFLDSGVINLTSGLNVIVGRNNAGKTALLQALSLNFANHPHRSKKTVPQVGNSPQNLSSFIDITFDYEPEELYPILQSIDAPLYFPSLGSRSVNVQIIEYNRILKSAVSVVYEFSSGGCISSYFENIGKPKNSNFFAISYSSLRGGVDPTIGLQSGSQLFDTLRNIGDRSKSKIFFFQAQRYNIAEHQVGHTTTLESDASNLPQVLNRLQTANPILFQTLQEHLTWIFPQITQVTIPPREHQFAHILLWSTEPSEGRDDLAIRLSDSGTGIGQVLAILYVVLTSRRAQVIIIDEPQSFLHPGAVRKLFGVLAKYPLHQYIIATHSPIAVADLNTTDLLLISKKEEESVVSVLDMSDTLSQRSYLLEIGARLSDVFGADNILWVEGATEEQAFPKILKQLAARTLMGTVILGVVQTGDFEAKDSDRVLTIYRKLTSGRGLIPPTIGFLFDREDRSKQKLEDMEKQKIQFLPRRMYENYLLHSPAINAVLSEIGNPVSVSAIEDWLNTNKWDDKYFSPPKRVAEPDRSDSYWCTEVHGANLLADLVSRLTDSQINYPAMKVEFGVRLTDWILINMPQELQEVVDLLIKILDNAELPESNG